MFLSLLECDDPLADINGEVVANGSVASYTCKAGYNMKGETTRYCQASGKGWNGTTPVCGNNSNLFHKKEVFII